MKTYKKIDIFLQGLKPRDALVYECSTIRSKTCKQAKAAFLLVNNYLSENQVQARFSK
jgi:hypothetical protein